MQQRRLAKVALRRTGSWETVSALATDKMPSQRVAPSGLLRVFIQSNPIWDIREVLLLHFFQVQVRRLWIYHRTRKIDCSLPRTSKKAARLHYLERYLRKSIGYEERLYNIIIWRCLALFGKRRWKEGTDIHSEFVVNLCKQSKHWKKLIILLESFSEFAMSVQKEDCFISFDVKKEYRHFRLAPAMRDCLSSGRQAGITSASLSLSGGADLPLWFIPHLP